MLGHLPPQSKQIINRQCDKVHTVCLSPGDMCVRANTPSSTLSSATVYRLWQVVNELWHRLDTGVWAHTFYDVYIHYIYSKKFTQYNSLVYLKSLFPLGTRAILHPWDFSNIFQIARDILPPWEFIYLPTWDHQSGVATSHLHYLFGIELLNSLVYFSWLQHKHPLVLYGLQNSML